ncbi:MAG: hypothetical protein A2096_07485 [Spirochaetes bacterium GWF1_41_5]|nr:MAG: hypothetical protein A2096_07485 [Spirochaetes bacterium GWF1_41_5]
MKRFFILIILSAIFSLLNAAEKGTAPEAEKMVKDAFTFIEKNGRETAFREFTTNRNIFHQKDLFIFIVDFKGVILAQGGNPALLGKNMLDSKDPDGRLFIREMIELASQKNTGWIDYKWENPATGKIEKKSSFVMKYKNEDFLIGCGIYP